MTFRAASEAYIASHAAGWRNPKHGAQWRSTLEVYAYPTLGELPVDQIALSHVLAVLDPIWRTKTETASRLRGRIQLVLDWCTARGHRSGDNPARWRGNLKALLPEPAKVAKPKHHAALPIDEAGAFLQRLRAMPGVAARALEFAILTAARSGEVRGACWGEVDLASGVWTVPGNRMKAGREHRVPLGERCLELLRERQPGHPAGLLFTGPGNKPLSENAFLALLRRMGASVTSHGFRSTFRDWAAERTAYPHEVAEMALAHAIGNKAEAAYRRGDLFDKRRRMMADWAAFLEQPARRADVLPLRARSD